MCVSGGKGRHSSHLIVVQMAYAPASVQLEVTHELEMGIQGANPWLARITRRLEDMKPKDDIADAEAESLREPHISIRVLTKEDAERASAVSSESKKEE